MIEKSDLFLAYTPAPGIISLNPDGSIDPEFVAPVTREIYDYQPAYLKRQPDGSFPAQRAIQRRQW
jgi:hypothetical protein